MDKNKKDELAESAKKMASDAVDNLKNISADEVKKSAEEKFNKLKNNKLPASAIRMSIIGIVLIAVIAFKMIASSVAEEKINKVIEEMPPGLAVTYDSISVDLLGLNVHINDIKINIPGQKEAVIDEIVINSIDSDNKVPTYLDIDINGLNLDTEVLKIDRKMSRIIEALDYKNLKSDIAFSYSFNEDKGLMEIENLSVALEDAGELSYNAKFDGIKSMNSLAAMESIKVLESSIVFEDNSLTKRLIKMAATEEGKSVGTFKEKLSTELHKEMKNAEAKGDKLPVKFFKEVITYLENPESFEISISPTKALSMRDAKKIESLDELMKIINLDIRAN